MNTTPFKDTITVEVDAEVQSIVPEFLENRKKDCFLINNLLEMGSFSEIRTLAHRMKGAGGSYGFDDISAIGEIMEEAALSGDKIVISNELQRLMDFLERVVVVYV